VVQLALEEERRCVRAGESLVHAHHTTFAYNRGEYTVWIWGQGHAVVGVVVLWVWDDLGRFDSGKSLDLQYCDNGMF
jgi:phosphoketolase